MTDGDCGPRDGDRLRVTDGGREPRDGERAAATSDFYSVFAGSYDRLARAPLVGRLRRRVAAALAPPAGGVVVEFGCGTGANHSAVRDRIGPDGRYVGCDLAPGALRIARRREAGPRTAFLRGDATRPPVRPSAPDAALATFLVGMLSDPAAAVRRWARLVGPGGRLALCNFRRTTVPVFRPLNPAFAAFVRLVSPASSGAGSTAPPVARLDRRVTAAHDALRTVATPDSFTRETLLGGFCVLSAGTVAADAV